MEWNRHNEYIKQRLLRRGADHDNVSITLASGSMAPENGERSGSNNGSASRGGNRRREAEDARNSHAYRTEKT